MISTDNVSAHVYYWASDHTHQSIYLSEYLFFLVGCYDGGSSHYCYYCHFCLYSIFKMRPFIDDYDDSYYYFINLFIVKDPQMTTVSLVYWVSSHIFHLHCHHHPLQVHFQFLYAKAGLTTYTFYYYLLWDLHVNLIFLVSRLNWSGRLSFFPWLRNLHLNYWFYGIFKAMRGMWLILSLVIVFIIYHFGYWD